MGYLLFIDALGIQNYYNKGVEFANPIMDRIILNAKNVFNKSLPEVGVPMKNDSANELCIMNDTIFVYSIQLTNLLYFSVRFLKSMFIPKTNTEPIAFRGAIAKTEKSPKIISEKNGNMNISKLVIDNISSAMVAEKQKTLGSRILIPKEMIDINIFRKWDTRYSAYIMDVGHIKNITDTNILIKGFENYYDLAWMIGSDEKQEKKIYENTVRFWEHAVFNEHASLHASATMALLHASQEKKKRIINYFNKIYNKQKKYGYINDYKPKEFKEWCEYAKKLKNNQENGLLLLHP
jgi:hypothetical protein